MAKGSSAAMVVIVMVGVGVGVGLLKIVVEGEEGLWRKESGADGVFGGGRDGREDRD